MTAPAPNPVIDLPNGAIAVIFTSQRTADDNAGYAQAAAAMEARAATQPGYLGFVAARGTDGVGIATSYWVDDAAARAWRAQADHSVVREAGRARWYQWTHVVVARIERSYAWERPA
ncbi:MAG: hypothetical protein RLZZ58_876 [Pseudomonadota bacterium]